MEILSLILCFIFSICVSCVVGQDEPEIAKQILPEIKRKGMTGYLNCTVTRQGNSKVFWSHVNRRLEISQDDQVTVGNRFNQVLNGLPKYEIFRLREGDGFTYQLVIHRLSQIDIGEYNCKIQVSGTGSIKEKQAKLLVLVPPDIQPGETTHTLSIPEGQGAQLECSALGYPDPNITWVRPNGKPIPGRGFSYQGKQLNLTDIQLDDRGMYRCVADNNVRPPATYDATLFVEFKPSATPVQTTYGQRAGDDFDITIECIIAGYPPPDLRWYKVTQGGGLTPITDGQYTEINTLLSHGNMLTISEVWYQLTIRNLRSLDLGDYICEGFNKHGRGRATINIYETDLCQGANCPDQTEDTSAANTLSYHKLYSLAVILLAALV